MFSRRFSRSTQSLVYFASVFFVAVAIVSVIGKNYGSAVVLAQDDTVPVLESPNAAFPGTGTGAIPDDDCDGPGLVISFAVTGITPPITDVQISFTGTHTWVGDIDMLLRGPGTMPVHEVFTFVNPGATAAGDSSNLNGTYNFLDTAPNNWWAAAAAGGDTFIIPGGNYRTASSTGTNTSILPTFAGVANPNGTWTLKVNDCAPADTGSITAATLTVTGSAGPAVTDALGDFDGDGRTDFTVIRDTGIASVSTWHINLNQSGNFYTRDWGLGGDSFIPADFDADGKDDVAVWRPGLQSTFYIIQSQTNTIRIVDFGITGDDPSVVGDYNADGKDDFAVWRQGLTPGSQSTFYWMTEGSYNIIPWGINGDFVAPGDYDGDNRLDFGVQRTVGSNSQFFIRYSSGIADTSTTFGLANDVNVPGDYDGDGETDLCVMTPDGLLWRWTYRPSGGGPDVTDTWGLVATDFPAPGDYTGDGRADYGVWRDEAPATFWAMTPVTRLIQARQWGIPGDRPATQIYSH